MMKTERLTSRDRDEILSVLNRSFTRPGHTADFEKNLPIMWTGEHDYPSRHFGVREDGRLIAMLGVYPLPVSIAGHDLLFSTVGNVATLQEARGKGCMKLLMDAAMEELAHIGADASRLGGIRSRYNRFGYDHAGRSIRFTLTRRNAAENPPAQPY
ncbi:MAG: GNAT family N-acetyltransferase [Clostridia bacterium]|nr:GNAT family N-acetyltransferase [Clostridia bacterium]